MNDNDRWRKTLLTGFLWLNVVAALGFTYLALSPMNKAKPSVVILIYLLTIGIFLVLDAYLAQQITSVQLQESLPLIAKT